MTMSTQSNDMFDAWNRFQEQWWASWSDAVTKTSGHHRPTTSPYATWQEMLDWSMKAQAEWTRLLMSGTAPKTGMGMPTAQWEEQINLLTRLWLDAQRQTLESWLQMVTNLNTMTPPPAWTDSMTKTMQSWRKLSQDMLDTQAELVPSSEKTGPVKKKAARKKRGAGKKDVA